MEAEHELRDDTFVRAPEHVLTRKAAGETVLLNLESEEYYGLEGVGTRLWELIESGGTTVAAAVGVLRREYTVSGDVLAADVKELIADLQRSGLVLVDAP
jgi:hypothetical protein